MRKIIFYFDNSVTRIFKEITTEEGEKKTVLTTGNNFVSRTEIVARIIDIDNEEQIPTRIDPGYSYYNVANYIPLQIADGLYFDESQNSYKASEYGFVIYDGKFLRLLSPLKVSRDKVKAHFSIFPTKFGKIPTVKDIEETVHGYQIMASLGEKQIQEQLQKINPAEKKLHRILVAQGKAPINGHEEYYTPLISLDKKAGQILSDGRIDYKETGGIIEVHKGQELLQRTPAVKQVDGFDVYGDKLPSDIEPPQGYKRGSGIVQSGHDPNIFLGEIDGCLVEESRVISVLPVVNIKGDVDYDTGNVDFHGSVHIHGSVLPGFSVKASGDIIIEKSVEDALIKAEGDITIKEGVVGKESVKILSGGTVTAKYLLNAKVEAVKDIIVEDSIINCDVFANNKIQVVSKNGKIIGGKSTALHEIEINTSGNPNDTETILTVGRNLYIEKELSELRVQIDGWRETVNEVIRKLKVSYGEGVFENPKEYIAILPAVKKKNCLLLLKELSDSNKKLKELVEESKKVQEKLVLNQEPFIIIKHKAFPGTVLNIKKQVRKIDKEIENVKFYEDKTDKTIRFTSAV